MADSAWVPRLASPVASATTMPRHSVVVRATHWVATLCFFALLVTGTEILISHPRFYWGEAGNVLAPSLFDLPIPASRSSVKTGYGFVLRDQNSWSRSLHFQAAWIALFTGLLYAIPGLITGHFRRNLLPARADLSWRAVSGVILNHLRFKLQGEADHSYNLLQRLAYLFVLFIVFPLMMWTGLAMSPAFTSAFPATATVFGGQQSARTIHFFATLFLVFFLMAHVMMVCIAGFGSRMRAMIIGGTVTPKERP